MEMITRTPEEWKKIREERNKKFEQLNERLIVVKDGKTYFFDVQDANNKNLVAVAVKTDIQQFCSIYDGELEKVGAPDAYAFLRERVISKITNNTDTLIRSGYMKTKEGDSYTTKTAEERILEICKILGKTPIDIDEYIENQRFEELIRLFQNDDAIFENIESIKALLNAKQEPSKYPEMETEFYKDNGYVEASDDDKLRLGLYNPEVLN